MLLHVTILSVSVVLGCKDRCRRQSSLLPVTASFLVVSYWDADRQLQQRDAHEQQLQLTDGRAHV